MKLTTAAVVLISAATSMDAASAAPPPAQAQQALLGPMADLLSSRVGIWDVRADLRLQPGARPVSIAARANSRLIGNRWLVTELRGVGTNNMPRFEGLGVNGFDPAAGHYVGYWVDGTRGLAIPVSGTYDERTGVFTTSSVERNGDGSTSQVRSETRRTSPDTEVTTFTATDARGQPYVRMLLTYTRAKDAQAGATTAQRDSSP